MKKTAILLVMTLALFCTGCANQSQSAADATEASTAADTIMIDQTYNEGLIGTTMTTAFFDFTIDHVFTSDQLGNSKPSDGKEFLVARFDIRNNTDQTIDMCSMDFQVQWGDETEEAFAVPVSISDVSIGSYLLPSEYTLTPNEEKIGYYVFEVPDGSVNMNISYLEQYTDGTQGNVYFVFFEAYDGSFGSLEESTEESSPEVTAEQG